MSSLPVPVSPQIIAQEELEDSLRMSFLIACIVGFSVMISSTVYNFFRLLRLPLSLRQRIFCAECGSFEINIENSMLPIGVPLSEVMGKEELTKE